MSNIRKVLIQYDVIKTPTIGPTVTTHHTSEADIDFLIKGPGDLSKLIAALKKANTPACRNIDSCVVIVRGWSFYETESVSIKFKPSEHPCGYNSALEP